MLSKSISTIAAVSALLLVPVAGVAADRAPTAEERTKIETVLRAAGYVMWEEIEFDDGMWEVDDAKKNGDNREFDLKLDPQSFAIKSERLDD